MKPERLDEWLPFDGHYEKVPHDIRLHDGTEHLKCWPNAGDFIRCGDHSGLEVPGKHVAWVRPHPEEIDSRYVD